MISSILRLFRPKLALFNGFAAVGGYLLMPARPDTTGLLATLCGVTLMAAGASAINQVLERDLDRSMERTKLRPIPNGDLSAKTAGIIGAVSSCLGMLVIAAAGGPAAAVLGALALVWYLCIYTPLKRHTPLALALGAVSGALPPVIGWRMAGGDLTDFRVMLLASLLYLWQLPHFWLFQRRHHNDYRRAGLPCFGAASLDIARCRLWIAAFVAAAMLFPLLGLLHRHIFVWYAVITFPLLLMFRRLPERALFAYLNLFPLLLTLILADQGLSLR